jgi:hypothetical protein
MKTPCTISTPQFVDGRVHHYHRQSGTFDTATLLFTPYRANGVGGDHAVQFSTLAEWITSCAIERGKMQFHWNARPHFGFVRSNASHTRIPHQLCIRWILYAGFLTITQLMTPEEVMLAVTQYLRK